MFFTCFCSDPQTDYNAWNDHIDNTDSALDVVSMVMLCLLLSYQIILCVVMGFWAYVKDYNR